jgi:hypothetical protein
MFKIFSESLEGIPPKALLGLLKREYETITDALQHQRITKCRDIDSILSFCQFMNVVTEEKVIFPAVELPVEHFFFYRKIILRLIEAREIPESTGAKFDTVFSSGFMKSLANN